MKELELPGYRAEFQKELPERYTLMVLGGRKPPNDWLKRLNLPSMSVWAVDSGAEVCMAAGLPPHVLLGDRDSSSAEAWLWAQSRGAEVSLHEIDKDLTDFQLALKKFKRELDGGEGLALTGCFGGRLDHLWSLVVCACNAGPEARPVFMVDHAEALFLLEAESAAFEFERKPDYISLLSFSEECREVGIGGVRWPLADETLRFDYPYSVSNRPFENRIDVSVGSGLMGVYFVFRDFRA